jgi:hypothetical protein
LTNGYERYDKKNDDSQHNDTLHKIYQYNDTQHCNIKHYITQDDSQHNDTKNNDTQHIVYQYNDTHQNGIQHINTQDNVHCIIALSLI